MTKDLSRHFSMKSIAETLGVSETSLKRYFHSVYEASRLSPKKESEHPYLILNKFSPRIIEK